MGMDYMNGLVCRLATIEDYQSVVDIDNNVYEGADYVPYMYHQYVNDPNRLCFVAIKDKEVVSTTYKYKYK